MDNYEPVYTRKHLPWIKQLLLQAIKKRNSLLKKYKARLNSALKNVRYLRNRITALLRKAKHAYFNKLHHVDSKKLLKLQSRLTSPFSNVQLRVWYQNLHENKKKANLLNAKTLTLMERTCLRMVNVSDVLADLLYSEETLYLPLLTTLDTNKSPGADGISALMLKQTAYTIGSRHFQTIQLIPYIRESSQ